MTVVGPPPDSDYRAVAEAIAADRGSLLVTDLDDLPDGEVLFVTHPLEFSADDVLRLQRRLVRNGPSRGRFGVITGRTPAEALALYEESSADRSGHGIVLRQEDEQVRSRDPETTVLTRDGATTGELAALTERPLASLSVTMDSLDIHAFLSDGLLCGFPSDPDRFSFDGAQPDCVVDGERDCPYDRELLAADDLEIGHVFLNACSSMVPDTTSTTGAPVHLGLALLAGADSLVGGYRPMEGIPQETALHYALLRAGYDAATRCYLCNRNSHALNVEPYPYAVFGRPGAAIDQGRPGEYRVEVAASDGDVEVLCHDVDSYVVEFTVPDEHVRDGHTAYLRNREDEQADWPLYYTALPEADGTRVLVFSWGRIEADELRFGLHDRSGPLDADATVVRRSLNNLRGLDELGLTDRKVRGQLRSLRNQFQGLTEAVEQERYHANAFRDSGRRVERLLDDVRSVRDRVCETLDSRGPGFLSSEYQDRVVRSEMDLETDDCYHCGRPVFVRRKSVLQGSVERLVGFCPYCINVMDVPAHADATAFPRIRGDLEFVDSRTRTVEVSFTNPTDAPMDAAFHAWLWSAREEARGTPVFDPATVDARLGPDGTRTVRFDIDVSPLDRGGYSIYAYVVGNLDVYLSTRRLLVVEEQ